jgi:hypothetical protein
MANWIEAVPEPKQLFVAWQAPDHLGERYRWAVALLSRTADGCTFRYFQPGDDFSRWNDGRKFDDLLALSYQGYPAFSPRREFHLEGVLSAFMRRLPPRARPDFEAYKRQFRLTPASDLSDFALLGLTEAKLPSDGFSLVDPLDGKAARRDLMLEVAGHRYYAEQVHLSVGDAVTVEAEPGNQHDPNAVVMRVAGRVIGYINRLQATAFQRWLTERDVSAVIERLNGQPGRPRAFVFVKVRPARSRLKA